jgi:hypothetical protein
MLSAIHPGGDRAQSHIERGTDKKKNKHAEIEARMLIAFREEEERGPVGEAANAAHPGWEASAATSIAAAKKRGDLNPPMSGGSGGSDECVCHAFGPSRSALADITLVGEEKGALVFCEPVRRNAPGCSGIGWYPAGRQRGWIQDLPARGSSRAGAGP